VKALFASFETYLASEMGQTWRDFLPIVVEI